MICGDRLTGAFNNKELPIEVQMHLFDGDMTFDASASDFDIVLITASPKNDSTIIDYVQDKKILTIVDRKKGENIIFTIWSPDNTFGTFDVSIICTSDSPTNDPTSDPTTDPTSDPTTDPTNDPTSDPTSDPTLDPTNDPTTDPTYTPTKSPTPQLCTHKDAFTPQSKYELAIIADNSCGLTSEECEIQLNQIAELLLILNYDNSSYDITTNIAYIEYGETAKDAKVVVGLQNALQNNVQDYYDFIINNGGCGGGGNGKTDIVSGLQLALQEFKENGDINDVDIVRKVYTINNCIDYNLTNETCDSIHFDYERYLPAPVDRVLINIPAPSNRADNTINGKSNSYGKCFVAPTARDGAIPGGICGGENDEEITIDDYLQFYQEPTDNFAGDKFDCRNEFICAFTPRIGRNPTSSPTLDPTNDPTTDPTSDPTQDPTSDPTNDPTRDPTSDPTPYPSPNPTGYPTDWPTPYPTIAPTTCPPDWESEWSEWGKWSNCSTWLDHNNTDHYRHIRYRTRECICPSKGKKCVNGSYIEIEECDADCITFWSPWCPWSQCLVQNFDCITDKTANCSGFRFRTRSCFRQLPNNDFAECKGNCSCQGLDDDSDDSSQIENCETNKCLKIEFDDEGNNNCHPQWRFERENDNKTPFDNHIIQQGGYLGQDCIIIDPDIDYSLIVTNGCGKVSWKYKGKQRYSFSYDNDIIDTNSNEYNYKSFPIRIEEEDTV